MSNQTQWIDISVSADPLLLEELSASFFALGCQGIHEETGRFTLYFEQDAWNDSLKMLLADILAEKKITADKITYHQFRDEDWIAKWKEHFKTFRVGRHFVIRPDWEQGYVSPADKVITITPKMAFGTGHHETTQLILKQLEGIITAGMSVLDAGTGSAILAIAAALLGAAKISAFDIDPVAIENAQENVRINGVSQKIDLKCAALQDIEVQPYDCIIANINCNVLLHLPESFKNYSGPQTVLLLSGLLIGDEHEIMEKYSKAGWRIKARETQGEWLCLQFM